MKSIRSMIGAVSVGGCLVLTAAAAQAGDWAIEGFGGVRFEDNLSYGGVDFDTDQGSMFGARVLYTPTGSNLSYGAEYNASRAEYTGYDSSVNSKALMAVARYTFPTQMPVNFYVGAGLGAVEVEYDGGTAFAPFSGSESTFGGQVSLGVSYDITDQFSVLGEFIHQRAFDDVSIAGEDVGYSSNNLVIGARFSF